MDKWTLHTILNVPKQILQFMGVTKSNKQVIYAILCLF